MSASMIPSALPIFSPLAATSPRSMWPLASAIRLKHRIEHDLDDLVRRGLRESAVGADGSILIQIMTCS